MSLGWQDLGDNRSRALYSRSFRGPRICGPAKTQPPAPGAFSRPACSGGSADVESLGASSPLAIDRKCGRSGNKPSHHHAASRSADPLRFAGATRELAFCAKPMSDLPMCRISGRENQNPSKKEIGNRKSSGNLIGIEINPGFSAPSKPTASEGVSHGKSWRALRPEAKHLRPPLRRGKLEWSSRPPSITAGA